MPPLNRQALMIALLPTVIVSFLAHACVGSGAVARDLATAAAEVFEGGAQATVTATDCVSAAVAEPGSDSSGGLPPSFLSP